MSKTPKTDRIEQNRPYKACQQIAALIQDIALIAFLCLMAGCSSPTYYQPDPSIAQLRADYEDSQTRHQIAENDRFMAEQYKGLR